MPTFGIGLFGIGLFGGHPWSPGEQRYWVSPVSANYYDTNVWSVLPDGTASALYIPGPSNTIFFGSFGVGSCLIDDSVNVLGMEIDQGYTGFIRQSNFDMTVTGGALFDGGAFIGGGANIQINGDASIANTQFISTDSTLLILRDLTFEQKPATGVDIIKMEEIPLGNDDIIEGKVFLSGIPDPNRISMVVLNIVHGGPQVYGSDYYIYGPELRWGGLALDGILSVGDILRVIYVTRHIPGFFSNNGTVSMENNLNTLNGGGISFNDLHFYTNTLDSYTYIDGTSFVEGRLLLESGCLKDAGGVLTSRKDILVSQEFGKLGPNNKALILMDGVGKQTILVNGGTLPSVTVDKTSSQQVICNGSGPLRINGDFTITDGTVNTNGLDLLVGL